MTFLVGSERSGTTLLRLMLDSHPELAFRYEFEIAVELMPDERSWPDLESYYELLSTYRFVDGPPPIDRNLDYPELVRSFLEHKRVGDRKPRSGATVHKHFDRLLAIWPDARFIHLVRDGRDVAQSCVTMGWYGNAWSATERWITAELLWDRMTRLVPPERRIDVRYEDLIADPVTELTRICAFIGIGYDPAMMFYPEHSTYGPPNPAQAYQWRRKLTPRQVQQIESRIGDLLVARGYALSDQPLASPTPTEEFALRVQDRIGRARARLHTYGPNLWAQSVLARRVGSRSWRDAVTRRLNDAMNRQLD